jgi:hypothetical protein
MSNAKNKEKVQTQNKIRNTLRKQQYKELLDIGVDLGK